MDNTLICPACGELAGVLLCDINEFFCKKCSIIFFIVVFYQI